MKGKKVIIISGPVSSGKTTFLQKIVISLQQQAKPVAGIICLKGYENNQQVGYDLFDISSGERVPFLRNNNLSAEFSRIGRFNIMPEGLIFGNEKLQTKNYSPGTTICVDEIGRLELESKGWNQALKNWLKIPSGELVIVVRDTFLDEVISHFEITNLKIYYTNQHSENDCLNDLLKD